MIPFHSLSYLLPASVLALTKSGLYTGEGNPVPLAGIRAAVSERVHQFRADLGGDPEVAEHIYRIVNSAIKA
jgi:hypothetical protein